MAKIKIKNIYYMLSYAFRILNEEKYQDIKVEEFDYVADLLSAILVKGLSGQIKRGLGRDYIQRVQALTSPHGKIDISNSIKEKAIITRKLVCVYDSYEENTYLNQILKSTTLELIKSEEVKNERKKALKKLMLYFDNVDIVNLRNVEWNKIQYSKNNATYKMLINICYLVVKGLILTDEKGSLKMSKYIDDRRMYELYEKFILEYYKKHFPYLQPSSSYIDWIEDNNNFDLLPIMKTDITLKYKGKITIIDAKFYSEMFQYNKRFNSKSLHSENLYQIFTYVKNKDINNDGSVSGVLLYAKTEDEESINHDYIMSGNEISVKSLDLNADFEKIRKSLDEIAEKLYKK